MKNIEKILVSCTDSGKTIEAELLLVNSDRITVILPGFNKLTLYKSKNRPDFYTANQFGMEFYANYKK